MDMQKTLLLVLLFIPGWTSAGEACPPGCGGAAGLSCYCCTAGLGLADAEPLSWRPCSCCDADLSFSVPLDLVLAPPAGYFPKAAFTWPGLHCRGPAEGVQDPPLKPPRRPC
jgi:hypothetical protein